MPTYIFRDKLTDKVFEKYMSMLELDDFKKQNPQFTQVPTVLNAVSMVGSIKVDGGFKDVMNRIRANNYGSTMEKY